MPTPNRGVSRDGRMLRDPATPGDAAFGPAGRALQQAACNAAPPSERPAMEYHCEALGDAHATLDRIEERMSRLAGTSVGAEGGGAPVPSGAIYLAAHMARGLAERLSALEQRLAELV